MCMCGPVWVYVHHMHAGVSGGKKRASDSLELEVQVAVHHHVGAGD